MIILLFIFGLVVGSFLNSVIYRLDTGESLIKIRSHCPYCKKTLSFIELIPLVSFILQKGKCKNCRRKISWQYPLVELVTGALFVLVFNFSAQGGLTLGWQFSNILSIVFWFFVVSCLVIIFVYDLKHYIIPDEIIYPAIVVSIFYRLFEILNFGHLDLFRIGSATPSLPDFGFRILERFGSYFIAVVIAGGFFLLIILISRGKWMGVGDVKLAVFMGLVLGWPKILVALFLAFLVGAFVSIALIILKKKTLKSEIPFGPFLAASTIITIFLGNVLLDWYLNLLSV